MRRALSLARRPANRDLRAGGRKFPAPPHALASGEELTTSYALSIGSEAEFPEFAFFKFLDPGEIEGVTSYAATPSGGAAAAGLRAAARIDPGARRGLGEGLRAGGP
jgi:hypothetical protein